LPAPAWQLAQWLGPTPACVYATGIQAVVRWHASHDSAVGRWPPGIALAPPPALWHVRQLPGGTPKCEYGPVPASDAAPEAARPRGPVVGATGVPDGRTAGPPVGLGLALAAAAAAAAKPPVELWQSMQSAVVELPWWLPIVAVLKLTPYHLAPLGAWQVTQRGLDDPLLLLPLPLVQVMNGPFVCGTVVPLKPPGTVVEAWQMLQAVEPNGRCCAADAAPPLVPGGFSGWPPACPCAVP
jgi:hypothetical protein